MAMILSPTSAPFITGVQSKPSVFDALTISLTSYSEGRRIAVSCQLLKPVNHSTTTCSMCHDDISGDIYALPAMHLSNTKD